VLFHASISAKQEHGKGQNAKLAEETAMGHEVIFTDDNFEREVLQSDSPVLVDFWAAWCGPCKAIASVVEELAEEYSGKVKIGKLNVDENPNTASNYGVRSIPTLITFKGGKQEEQTIGVQPKQKIKEILDKLL
jgi:thioredoxin 1